MDELTEVKLLMEDGRADGLEVRRLTLTEGVCRIPTAEVVLWSNARAIKMDALADYVERPAALEISRTDSATMRRTTRWFSGMVSSVEGCGVVAHGRDGNVFEYHMTIQPRLVNLCYSRSGRNFCKVKALDAVREILKGVDNVMYDTEGLSASAQMEQDFFQYQENDYGFLMRILASCGLCYTFRTPAQGANGPVRMPEMYVGPGKNMPTASEFLVDGRAVQAAPSDFSCSAIRTDGRFCRMDSWRMRKSIGVDSIDVGYTNRNGADVSGSAGKGDVRHVRMYEELSADATQSEIDRLAVEALTQLRLPTMGWAGSTQCLEAMPGQNLKVSHFYGEAEDDVITALVISSTMDCTLPALIGRVNLADGAKASVSIAIRCLSDSEDEVSGVQSRISAVSGDILLGATPGGTPHPDLNLGAIPAANGLGAGGGGGGGGKGLRYPNIEKATVVRNDGTKSDEKNQAVKFVDGKYVFKAIPESSQTTTAVDVVFTQAVGGYGQGLFRMPRIGDRVLLFVQPIADGKCTYYLLAYLPGDAMPFTTEAELKRTTKAGCKTECALPEEMMSLRFQASGSTPGVPAQENCMAIRRTRSSNPCSELAFYNTHVGKQFAEGTRKESDDDGKKVLANFQSAGNMQLTANNVLDVSARDIRIGCPNWQKWTKDGANGGEYNKEGGRVIFDDINELVVKAKYKIKFQVGENFVSISPNGVAIRALKWNSAGGPMDSYIYMDALSGVNIGGLNCTMNGFFGASIGDTMGAGVNVGAGAVSTSGTIVSASTTPLSEFISHAVSSTLNFAWELGAFGAHAAENDTAGNALYFMQTLSDFAADAYRDLRTVMNAETGTGKHGANLGLSITVFKFVIAIVDVVRLGIDAFNPDLLNQPAAGQKGRAAADKDYVTVRDVFRLLCLILKASIYSMSMSANCMEAFKKELIGGQILHLNCSSSLTLRRGHLEMKTSDNQSLCKGNVNSESVLAGFDLNKTTINNLSSAVSNKGVPQQTDLSKSEILKIMKYRMLKNLRKNKSMQED